MAGIRRSTPPLRAPRGPSQARGPARRIVVLAFPDVQVLDVTGPLEVFAMASRRVADEGRGGRGYRATLAAPRAGALRCSSLVEEDCGREVALAVARRLVLFLKRPGGQSQFSVQLETQLSDRSPLRELQGWVADHPTAELSVEALARRVAMSPRHFARVFARDVGVTPARYVERVRVEVARRRLEETDLGVDAVAAQSGFGSAETLRRAFLRNLSVGPLEYRSRFREPASVRPVASARAREVHP